MRALLLLLLPRIPSLMPMRMPPQRLRPGVRPLLWTLLNSTTLLMSRPHVKRSTRVSFLPFLSHLVSPFLRTTKPSQTTSSFRPAPTAAVPRQPLANSQNPMSVVNFLFPSPSIPPKRNRPIHIPPRSPLPVIIMAWIPPCPRVPPRTLPTKKKVAIPTCSSPFDTVPKMGMLPARVLCCPAKPTNPSPHSHRRNMTDLIPSVARSQICLPRLGRGALSHLQVPKVPVRLPFQPEKAPPSNLNGP